MEIRCQYKYTDDYAWDAANDYGKHNWMDATDYFNDGCGIDWYFSTSSGGAWWSSDSKEEIVLLIHSNLSYRLRMKAEQPKAKAPANTTTQPSESFLSGLDVVDYSEKAVAIFGNTKAVKEDLKAAGARFNMYLTRDGVKTPGWILSKSVYNNLLQLA